MKILVVGTLYEPDLGPSAPLFTLLCEELVKRGHQVTVITMVPHYPSGQVRKDFRGKWFWRSVEHGVHVFRIWVPSVNRSKLAQRFLQYFCYQVGATLVGLNFKYEIVIAANPFLTVWLPFTVLAVIKRKIAIYSVHDVYPDVGMDLGIFKNRLLIKVVRGFENFCLKRSNLIRILSESFRTKLQSSGVPDSKMVLIYDWVDTDLIQPLPKNNIFSKEHNFDDKFIVLYAGNIGLSQGLEHVLSAAEQLSDQNSLLFVFVGDGTGKELLMKQAHQRGLRNVQFIPFQPRKRLPEVLASADVSLVILRQGIGFASLPSKIYSILASGRPIIISMDVGSEACELINRAGAGICVPPENPKALVETILALKQDIAKREKYGLNGRKWAEQYHSPQAAAQQFETLLLAALSAKKNEFHVLENREES